MQASTLKPITNRLATGGFQLPADGWFQLAPIGEYPNQDEKGNRVLQVLDVKSLRGMANRFAADKRQLLVDFDHFSYDPERSSEAAGWITDLQVRDDGLWAKAKWTDVGEQALANGRYRYVSPAWLPRDLENLGESRVRPLRMDSAGLTNQPNLRGMAPLSNRISASAGAGVDEPKPKTASERTMKTLCNRLGLSPDAAEEAVLAEVTKIITARDTATAEIAPLKNRITTLEEENKSLRETQAEADLQTYKDVIPAESREDIKAGLLANRDTTLKLLKGLKPHAQTQTRAGAPVLANRHHTSAGTSAKAGDTEDRRALRQREVSVVMQNRGCDFDTAWNLVRATHPDLFKD